MELFRAIIIITFTVSGFFFQMLPFMRKFKKYGKPSMSVEDKKDKALDRKYKQTVGKQETEEINNLYEDAFFVLFGFFLQVVALLFSLNS